jgi:hypothetical protein
MRVAKTSSRKIQFLQVEFLSVAQITSYFSRLVVKKRKTLNQKYSEEDLTAEVASTNFLELNNLAV